MSIHIEHPSRQISKKDGRPYWTFVLTIVVPGEGSVTGRGWRYYPSTGQLGAPKVKNSVINQQWLNGALYERVRQTAQDYFVSMGVCPVPWETPKPKEKAASEEMSDDQLKRLQGIAYQQGAKTPEQFEEWLKKREKKRNKR
jgi:hypothetical protein